MVIFKLDQISKPQPPSVRGSLIFAPGHDIEADLSMLQYLLPLFEKKLLLFRIKYDSVEGITFDSIPQASCSLLQRVLSKNSFAGWQSLWAQSYWYDYPKYTRLFGTGMVSYKMSISTFCKNPIDLAHCLATSSLKSHIYHYELVSLNDQFDRSLLVQRISFSTTFSGCILVWWTRIHCFPYADLPSS